MTMSDWAGLMTGDPLELSAYLDFLEEDGVDVGAAREVPLLAARVLSDRLTTEARYGADVYNYVIFRHHYKGSDRPGAYTYVTDNSTYWPHFDGFMSVAAALLAHGAYYGVLSAWYPVYRWVEEAVGLRRTTCRGIAEGVEVMFKWND